MALTVLPAVPAPRATAPPLPIAVSALSISAITLPISAIALPVSPMTPPTNPDPLSPTRPLGCSGPPRLAVERLHVHSARRPRAVVDDHVRISS